MQRKLGSAMASDHDHFYHLLHRYLSDELNNNGASEMWDYFSQHEEIYNELIDTDDSARFFEILRQPSIIPESTGKRMLERTLSTIGKENSKNGILHKLSLVRRLSSGYTKWAAAAILLLFLTISVYYWIKGDKNLVSVASVNPVPKHDIMPGKNGAILTLADGSKIVLDSLGNGVVANQGNTQVQLKNGQLLYGKSGGNTNSVSTNTIAYNTMSTPKGRQFQIVLPDGTKVWLNAASSITYPTAFTTHERVVAMTGEAYFEVVHNSRIPFRVKVGSQTIEDLGTHFNINAYDDEPAIKTTLLEGAVRLDKIILHPGQQASVNGFGKISVQSGIDVRQVIAWKNNLFSFNNADLPTVMRQLSRWYDIDVTYEGTIPQREFEGKIGKDLTLSQVLKILDNQQVNYKIEDKQVIIMP